MFDPEELQEQVESTDDSGDVTGDNWSDDADLWHGGHDHSTTDPDALMDGDSITFSAPAELRVARPINATEGALQPATTPAENARLRQAAAMVETTVGGNDNGQDHCGGKMKEKMKEKEKIKDKDKKVESQATEPNAIAIDGPNNMPHKHKEEGTLRTAIPLAIANLLRRLDPPPPNGVNIDDNAGRVATPAEQARTRLAEALATAAAATAGTLQQELQGPVRGNRRR